MKVTSVGLGLSGLTAVIAGAVWGWSGALAAGTFGLVATGIQVVATQRMLNQPSPKFAEFAKQWGIGMGLRLLGVVLLVAAVLINPALFPPLPTALGFLGVLIPLMAVELQVLRAKRAG